MTNNLKAERTLTAEELQAILEEATVSSGFLGQKTACVLSARAVRSMVQELQYLRSQSLSTQQPMGEVTDEMVERACLSFIPHWYDCTSEVKVEVFRDMRSAISAALHPNQESGE